MSYQAVQAVMVHSKAKSTERLVLMVIATDADAETFECFSGHERLSRFAGMSERSFIRHLHELEKGDELIVRRGNGRGNLTTYRLNLPRVKGVNMSSPFTNAEAVLKGDKMEIKDDNILTSFDGQERVTSSANSPERVTNFGERVTNPVIKGDKTVAAYIDIEPKETIKEQEEKNHVESGDSTASPVFPEVGSPEIKTPKTKPPVNRKSEKHSLAIAEVFSHWQSVLDHPVSKLDEKRKKAIRARLEEGFSVEDLKRAIEGCKASPFHQGENDQRKIYDELTLICRDAAKVEQFIGYLRNGQKLQVVNGNGQYHGPQSKAMQLQSANQWAMQEANRRNRERLERERRSTQGDFVEAEAVYES